MKAFGIIFLSIAVILGGFMPIISHAETELNKELETTVIKVKKLFNISNDYDNFTQRLDSDNGENIFYLSWSDSKEVLPSINVNIGADGFIKSFNKYYLGTEILDKTSKLTKEEARKIAFEFVEKVAPEIVKSIKLKENKSPLSINDDSYNFEFYRIENNIAFYDNNITLSINKFTGEANNYNANWDKEIIFPNPKEAITLEEAKTAFKDEIGLKLIYKNSYDTNWRPGPREMKRYLAYSLLNNNKAIDAFTGEVIEVNIYRPFADSKLESEISDASELTPIEQAETDKLKGLKSIELIEDKARDLLKLDESYKLTNKNLFTSWDNTDEFRWALQFKKTIDENNNIDININLNAKTEELISFYIYENQNPLAKPNINKEQSLELAKEYLKDIIGDKLAELEYVEYDVKDGELSYNFNFIRKLEGIYIEGDSVNIGIDTVNKKVVSYSINWYKDKMPSKANIISLDKAYEILFNNRDYELKYVKVYNQKDLNESKEEIKLVYAFKEDKPIIIDSNTGKFLDYNGKEYSENIIIEYVDIDKSYAKDKIITLSEYGISFKNKEFRPKEKMKQSDFLYLLWKSINSSPIEYNEPIEEIYKRLKDRGIIKNGEEDKEAVITKEEGVKYIIRTLNYDKIADEEGIFKDMWADSHNISKGLKGYMNIAYGLKIISGDGNTDNINPQSDLNREDGANIIYNYIFME
ncbi:MAG: hypothetical protein GX787_08135 [Tissierellia bacterium]|nr:hypothetical protein [Tissierellia bacterium]